MATLRVVLLCQVGMSTDWVAQRLKKRIAELELDMAIQAVPLVKSNVVELMSKCDVLLVAPQIRYQLPGIREAAKTQGIIVISIPFQEYGRADADGIIKLVTEAIESVQNDQSAHCCGQSNA